MSTCDALVVAVEDGAVLVEVAGRAPACGSCPSSGACHTDLAALGPGPRRFRLANRIGARVGDHVSLTVAEGTLWRAVLASYVIPLVLAMAGAAAGQSFGGDWAGVGGALGGLALGALLLRRRDRRLRDAPEMFSLQRPTLDIRFKEPS